MPVEESAAAGRDEASHVVDGKATVAIVQHRVAVETEEKERVKFSLSVIPIH